MFEIEPIRAQLAHAKRILVRVMASLGKPHTRIKNVVQTEVNNQTIWVLYMDVASAPVRGDANKELCTYLAKLFSNHTITLTSGHTSREKYVLITNQAP